MTLQNRVSPFGGFEADPARGTAMGKRGCLVNAKGVLVRPWNGERWITCVLDREERSPRPPMQPGRYTKVLTPPSTAAAMRAGWRPGIHPSARA